MKLKTSKLPPETNKGDTNKGDTKKGKSATKLLGGKLKQIRTSHHLSQAAMLLIINPHEKEGNRARISQYERSLRSPSLIEINNYARFAGCSVESLIEDQIDTPNSAKKGSAFPLDRRDTKSFITDNQANMTAESISFLREKLQSELAKGTTLSDRTIRKPEEASFLWEEIVLPAFEQIKAEFEKTNLNIKLSAYDFVARLDIKEKSGEVTYIVRINKPTPAVSVIIEYSSKAVAHPKSFSANIFEETFDFFFIRDELSVDRIIRIFNETFFSRRELIKKSFQLKIQSDNKKREIEEENEALRREKTRAQLIELKRHNAHFDPIDEFRKFLESPDFDLLSEWINRRLFPSDVSE